MTQYISYAKTTDYLAVATPMGACLGEAKAVLIEHEEKAVKTELR